MTAYFVPVDEGRPLALDKAIVLFGRHSDCDVVLTHSRKISRKHCCVAQVNNRLVIRDLGSLNGVWVNGDRVERETVLRLGDEVSIGDIRYRVADHTRLPERAGQRSPAQPRRAETARRPADLSLDVPVAIPESGEESVQPELKETPEAMPVMDHLYDAIPVADVASDDAYPQLVDDAESEDEDADVQMADSWDRG